MELEEAFTVGGSDVVYARRLMNDSIARSADRLGDETRCFEFACECGDPGCHQVIALTVAEYLRRSRHGPLTSH